MVFTIDQLNRFKDYAHRAMVRMDEWKNNRDVQVGRIVEEIQSAFAEGYHTAMREVCSTPWEYISESIMTDAARNDARMNQISREGWELQFVSSGWMFWRRRKEIGRAHV